ncbi:helix-turn-helix domain-containing protein [Lederbergia lenta]|uniref:Helix-turn-helix domain n=1 Tax=Lederbergia lenta TaxID=1467 RepID=A0A2X4WC32_LEDLE|nr:helix-turn-helix domain-containing protein [Lederbergia lenta]MCM3110381.1 helix-turn-helix domain-containing protein [Lederbergia lenta]MEC2324052.1 helix-turn-helix domain-containing protein [Lederbergia lenta]SQI60731.1 Helix-turn-helix domain [Lederbergia lenta]
MTKIVLETREDVENFIKNDVLTTTEAMEVLGVSRGRMSQLIEAGKITPIKKLSRVSLFLRSDLEEKKEELEELRKKYRPYDV